MARASCGSLASRAGYLLCCLAGAAFIADSVHIVHAIGRILSSGLRQDPPPRQPSPLGGGCSNDSDCDDADDNVAGDDDDDDDDGDDDDDHEEEEAELALGQRWDCLQLADFVLNVAQVDREQGGRNGRL